MCFSQHDWIYIIPKFNISYSKFHCFTNKLRQYKLHDFFRKSYCIFRTKYILTLYPSPVKEVPEWHLLFFTFPWTSCQIRKIAGAHAPGMPGTFSPSPQVSDPDMHHGTCVTHVPWCMPGSPTIGFLWNRWRGKTFPAFPVHAQPAILRIW